MGGWIVMGVDDTTLAPVGVTSVKYAKDNLIQASRLCQPTIVFDPPEPQVVAIDGRRLVVAYVPMAAGTLYQTGGAFYTRKGSMTVPLTLSELSALSYSRGLVQWELEPVSDPFTLADLDSKPLATFLATRDPEMLRHSSQEQLLVGLKAAVTAPGRGVVPTHAGILLFGRSPQAVVPDSELDCVEWRTPEDSTLTSAGGLWVDRRRVQGTLPELIEGAGYWVTTHVDTAARIEGLHRVDIPAYPLEAIREAIVNAVIHRDYSVGQAVRLFIYQDHIEVRSPGGLVPGVRLDLLEQGQSLSKPRNPVLMRLLREWPTGHYCERLGAGIRLMMGAMQKAGLPPPVFRDLGEEFVVYFYRSEEALAQLPPLPAERPRRGRPPAPPAIPGTTDPRLEGLNERQIRALEFVQAKGRINNEEYRTLNNTNPRMASRDLTDLMARGLLVRRGSGPMLHYVRPEAD
jgi:ATP-dependent DNA helicase RecG